MELGTCSVLDDRDTDSVEGEDVDTVVLVSRTGSVVADACSVVESGVTVELSRVVAAAELKDSIVEVTSAVVLLAALLVTLEEVMDCAVEETSIVVDGPSSLVVKAASVVLSSVVIIESLVNENPSTTEVLDKSILESDPEKKLLSIDSIDDVVSRRVKVVCCC